MFMEWKKTYCVGSPAIDGHHHHLFELLNQAFDACMLTRQKSLLSYVLKELDEYATYHFGAEEKLMAQDLYPDLGAHREQHACFILKIAELKGMLSRLDDDCTIELVELTQALMAWFSNHIQKVDTQYFNRMGSRNEDLH